MSKQVNKNNFYSAEINQWNQGALQACSWYVQGRDLAELMEALYQRQTDRLLVTSTRPQDQITERCAHGWLAGWLAVRYLYVCRARHATAGIRRPTSEHRPTCAATH